MTTWLNCLGALKNSTDQIKSEYLGLRPTHRYVFRDFSKWFQCAVNLKTRGLDWAKALAQLHIKWDTFSLPSLYPSPVTEMTTGVKWLDTSCHLSWTFCHFLGLHVLLALFEWGDELTLAACKILDIKYWKKWCLKISTILVGPLFYPFHFSCFCSLLESGVQLVGKTIIISVPLICRLLKLSEKPL